MKNAKISLSLIVISVIALGLIMAGLFTITGNTYQFAGFTWQEIQDNPSCGGGSFAVSKSGESLVMNFNTADSGGTRYIETGIENADEILIIYEGSGYASTRCDYGSAGMALYSQIVGDNINGVSLSVGGGTPCNPQSSNTFSATFAPAIWKFRNNFDGTWSSMQSLNIGDIFIVKNTAVISGTPKLRIGVQGGGSCGNGNAGGQLKIYNVVRKENAFAVCKADKYAYDANADGRIAADGSECADLATIVLNSERRINPCSI